MKLERLFLTAAVAAAISFQLAAQQPNPGYHTVACFKLKPDSSAAFHKFETDDLAKVAQGRVDDGELTSYYLLRSVFPQGESAQCDYLVVAFFPQMPHAFGAEQLQAAIRKAGLSLTPDDYFKHRDALLKLISVSVFQNQTFAGAAKKGDYFQVNYMRVANDNFSDYLALEKNVWKPFAEALIKDGKEDAWSVNVLAMPSGSDLPYQVVTVDAYPGMDAVFQDDPQFLERFKKVHPEREFGTTIERFEKLRTQARVELYALEELITAH